MDTQPPRHRTSQLTTSQMFELDRACELITRAYGVHPYLVGTAGYGKAGTRWRDVDIRLILPDDQFDAVCPTREQWELLSLSISAYLRDRTRLPVDFQVQRQSEANEKHSGSRNPLGRGRHFAGGGDGTPDWEGT